MANNFISPFAYLSGSPGTGLHTIYICPANKKTLIRAITLSNNWTGEVLASVVWQDVNNVGIGTTSNYLLTSGGVPARDQLTVIDKGYLALQSGDRIDAGANQANKVYIVISAMETDV